MYVLSKAVCSLGDAKTSIIMSESTKNKCFLFFCLRCGIYVASVCELVVNNAFPLAFNVAAA